MSGPSASGLAMLAVLADGRPRTATELAANAGVRSVLRDRVIASLRSADLIEPTSQDGFVRVLFYRLTPAGEPVGREAATRKASDALRNTVEVVSDPVEPPTPSGVQKGTSHQGGRYQTIVSDDGTLTLSAKTILEMGFQPGDTVSVRTATGSLVVGCGHGKIAAASTTACIHITDLKRCRKHARYFGAWAGGGLCLEHALETGLRDGFGQFHHEFREELEQRARKAGPDGQISDALGVSSQIVVSYGDG